MNPQLVIIAAAIARSGVIMRESLDGPNNGRAQEALYVGAENMLRSIVGRIASELELNTTELFDREAFEAACQAKPLAFIAERANLSLAPAN